VKMLKVLSVVGLLVLCTLAAEQQWAQPTQVAAPSWGNPTCSRVRRSWYAISDDEKSLYVEALNTLKLNGEYDVFTTIHAYDNRNLEYAHGSPGFFVWHRKFLLEFENALRSLGPRFACLTLPYWPFETEAGRESQAAIYNWFGGPTDMDRNGCVTHPNFRSWRATDAPCIHRTFNSQFSFIGEARIVDLIASNRAYGTTGGFRSLVEGAPHAAVHNYIGGGGGHMGTMASPNDPIFYLLHANIDRIFAIWEDCFDYERLTNLNLNAFASNPFESMPYWINGRVYNRFTRTTTPRDVYNIGTSLMPYTYDSNDRLVGLLSSTAGAAAQCRFNWFTAGQWSTKRSVEETEQYNGQILAAPSATQLVKFSDDRVQQSYDNVCTVEIPDAPKLYQIHVTAIAECNICTGHGQRKHASDDWIKMVNMENERNVFQPICAGHEATSAPKTAIQQQPVSYRPF